MNLKINKKNILKRCFNILSGLPVKNSGNKAKYILIRIYPVPMKWGIDRSSLPSAKCLRHV